MIKKISAVVLNIVVIWLFMLGTIFLMFSSASFVHKKEVFSHEMAFNSLWISATATLLIVVIYFATKHLGRRLNRKIENQHIIDVSTHVSQVEHLIAFLNKYGLEITKEAISAGAWATTIELIHENKELREYAFRRNALLISALLNGPEYAITH